MIFFCTLLCCFVYCTLWNYPKSTHSSIILFKPGSSSVLSKLSSISTIHSIIYSGHYFDNFCDCNLYSDLEVKGPPLLSICGLNGLFLLLSIKTDLPIMTVSLSILSPNSSLVSNATLLLAPSLILINELVEACPVNCLYNFSLVNIFFALSTACLKSSMVNNIQYNFVGSVMSNSSDICIFGLCNFIKSKWSPCME